MENENEAERYKSGYWLKQHLLAKCKLIYVGGIPVLVMEFVKQIPYKEMPDWADFIDCGQVGYNRRGNIVAYDYGN